MGSSSTADLNQDMLEEILKRSSIGCGGGLRSHMRFSRVCSSWRSVAANNPYKLVPWLMLSKLNSTQETRSFFGLDDEQIHQIKFSQEANSSWCSGSSQGWLVMTHHETSGNFLYNPITRDRINLPPHKDFVPKQAQWNGTLIPTEPSLYLSKAIVVTSSSLSSSPSNHRHDDDIVAVAVIFAENEFIGFCRPGEDEKWEVFSLHCTKPHSGRVPSYGDFEWYDPECDALDEIIDKIIDNGDYTAEYKHLIKRPWLADVIVYRGALYAVMFRTAMVGVFKFDSSSGTSRVIPKIQWLNMLPMTLKIRYDSWNYLVESCDGELLMVIRRRKRGTENGRKFVQTWRFLVFKLDESSDPMKWVRMKNLGDQILFLGINHSKSIRASDIPGSKGNCIYFTADFTWYHLWVHERTGCWSNATNSYARNDVGVFYLEDGRIETISCNFLTDEDAGNDLGGMRTFPSTVEYPAIFVTPNPSSSSSPFTITHDDKLSSTAAAAPTVAPVGCCCSSCLCC